MVSLHRLTRASFSKWLDSVTVTTPKLPRHPAERLKVEVRAETAVPSPCQRCPIFGETEAVASFFTHGTHYQNSQDDSLGERQRSPSPFRNSGYSTIPSLQRLVPRIPLALVRRQGGSMRSGVSITTEMS